MVKIFGKFYYIDIENIVNKCTNVIPIEVDTSTDNETNTDNTNEETNAKIEINFFKYDVIKMCIDRILNDYPNTEDDDDMSLFRQTDVNTSYKLAFNTLIKYNILIEEEDDE